MFSRRNITRSFLCAFQPRRRYSEEVVKRFNTPQNTGKLDPKDPNVGTGLVGAPACGDVLKLQIYVEDGKVKKSVFKTFGCASAVASSDYASEIVVDKTLDEITKITNKTIASQLNLPPVKLHCSMLAEDAIKAAVEDYRKKNQKDVVQEIVKKHV